MDTVAFIITTVAIVVLVSIFAYEIAAYVNSQFLQLRGYVESIIGNTIVYQVTEGLSVASIPNVVSNFNYTILLASSSIPLRGAAVNFNITLFCVEVNKATDSIIYNKGAPAQCSSSPPKGSGEVLAVNVSIIISTSTTTVRSRQPEMLLITSTNQPFNITAYGCLQGTVILLNNKEPTGVCTWTPTQLYGGKAVLEIETGRPQ